MNTTIANSAANALALGVSPRADSRKSGALEPSGQGDFQRMLTQAAEKRTAQKQQQTDRQESRQTGQRLQDHKLQERRLHENRLQESRLQENRLQESRSRENQQMEPRSEEQLRQPEIPQAREAEAAPGVNSGGQPQSAGQIQTGDQSSTQPAMTPSSGEYEGSGEVAAVERGGEEGGTLEWRDSELPMTAAVVADSLPEALGGLGFELVLPLPATLPDGGSQPVISLAERADLQPEASVTISLEDIAQAVVNFGSASGGAEGTAAPTLANSSPTGSALAEMFRSSPGAYYSNSGQQLSAYSQPSLADTQSVMSDDAVANAEFDLTALTRQLTATVAQSPVTEAALSSSQLREALVDSVGGAYRDSGAASTAASGLTSGPALDGKFASLMTGAAPGNPSAPLRAGLDQPEWHSAVAERVAVMAAKNLSSAEIQLDPPELGQLLVRVTLNQDQAIVNFSSQHAAVRDALDQTAHRLREMFEAEGLNLVNVDVSDRSFQQRQQQDTAAIEGEAATQSEPAAETVLVRQGQGLIDQFV